MIGKTVEFKLGKQTATGVILDKVLEKMGTGQQANYYAVTYYLVEHDDGLLSTIRVGDIIRIIQQSGIGHKPIQTK